MVSVTLPTERIREVVRRVAREITRVEAEAIADAARETWPVRTGRSLAGIVAEERPIPDGVRWVVGDTVPYARFIRSTKAGRRLDAVRLRYPYTVSIGMPARTAGRRIAQRVVQQAAAEVTRG